MSNKFTDSILTPVVSIVCTAAICITGAVCVNKVIKNDAQSNVSISAESEDAYLTEAEAAKYLGLDEARLVILRKNLKKLEGSYMSYTYTENDKEVQVIMYQKDKLDKAMQDLMKDSNSINFKFLEEALAKAEKAEK